MRTLQYVATVFVIGLIALFAVLAVWRFVGSPGEAEALRSQSIQLSTPTPDCTAALRDYKDRVAPILSEWHDALQLAIQSPRMSLAPQIATLQAINRRVNEIKPDLCVILAHMSLTESMNESIDGLLAFLGQKPEEEQTAHFEKATKAMDEYTNAVSHP